MTRRITLAILLTCWSVLVLGGAAAYLATRQTLLAELDELVARRAIAVPAILSNASLRAEAVLPEGDRLVVREAGVRRAVPAAAGPAPLILDRAFATLADGRRMRRLTLSVAVPAAAGEPRPMTIVYSTPADRFDRVMNRMAFALAIVGSAAGLATAWVALRVSRSALRPLRHTAEAIGQIDEQRLDRRVDAAALPCELAPMARRLNEMLSRLERGFAQRKQFLADAAHELRTPIAALLTTAEVSLRRPRGPEELSEALSACLAEAKLLKRLVDALLEQARSDAPASRVEAVDVSALLAACALLARTLAREQRVEIATAIAPGIIFPLQPARFQSIATNLLSNAVEYNVPGGRVELSCQLDGPALELTVRNTGPAIAAEDLPHIFEPFYRARGGRQSESGHLGLGLYLVKSHVEALGGVCEVRSPAGADGLTEFRVVLPAGSANAPHQPGADGPAGKASAA
jgi:two-component system heavy metal sensor histidine kinase CusS